MSPEMLELYIDKTNIDFNPEKSDIFSLGLTFLRSIN